VSSVFNSQGFKAICAATPEEMNYAEKAHAESNRKGIIRLTSSVVSSLQSVDSKVDAKQLKQFMTKVGLINHQFAEEGLGTPFTTSLFSINLLLNLRVNLGAHYGDLIAEPFTLELKALTEQKTVENKAEVAVRLSRYLEIILIPALRNADSIEEVQILENFVDQCMSLYEKVKVVDKDDILLQKHNQMVDIFNGQYFKYGTLFRNLASYTDGKIPGLESSEKRSQVVKALQGFVSSFVNASRVGLLTTDEKTNIYQKLVEVERSFEKHGAKKEFEEVMTTLNTQFGIPIQMRSHFPIALADGKVSLARHLYAFQKDVLIPFLENISTNAELKSVAPIIEGCGHLSDKKADVDTHGLLKEQKNTIGTLFQVKEFLISPLFLKLLTATSNNLGDISNSSRRKKIISLVTPLVNQAIKFSYHPLFSQEVKEQFFKGIEAIHEGFDKEGDGASVLPLVQELREAFGIPEVLKKKKSVSSSFAKARALFSNNENEEQLKTPIQKTKPKKAITLEERKKQALLKVQGIINKLDPEAISFRSDLREILREIGHVKKKYPEGITTDFEALEKTIQLLLDPSELSVSVEEELMIKKLGSKHGISTVATGNYKTSTEARAIREAQTDVIRGLRKSVSSLEDLNTIAGNAIDQIRVKTIRKRFELFVSTHPTKPVLTNHIAKHFPHLVIMLEEFSSGYAIAKVKETWMMIKELYDSNTDGKFSKFLSTYSYLNPETLIPEVLKEAQQAFLDGVNFNAVDSKVLIGFKAYMQRIIEKKVGEIPAKMFEELYKSYFSQRHTWLLDNLPYIKIPYNQGDEKNTNLGKGVCMSNSLNRIGILAQNPEASIEALTMGSTQKTRKNQALVGHIFRAADRGEVTYAYAHEQEIGQSPLYRVKAKPQIIIKNPLSNIHQNLVNQMVIHGKSGQTSFLVNIYSEKPRAGHAINIQFDPIRKIYRMMDDNIGLVDYPNEEVFKRELGKYFALNYSSYDDFRFTDFEPI